ncbi:MAG: CCA tRNA nucleotidyltransferase [Caldibacillus sp.]
MHQVFLKAVPILEKIEKAGYEAYFVGGSVRDYLLGKDIDDVDIATSALPEEVKAIFPKTVDVGIEHGTILVLYKGTAYEVTTFRTDGEYKDFRHPERVTFIRSLHEDLKRRDFTMNAIAMDKTGKIIDPFNGKQDLTDKRIRTVGKAEERFQEDALRIMRGVRFVSQLGFEMEEATYRALEEYAPLLSHIAVERIYAEFSKLLEGEFLSKALTLLVDARIHHYLPELAEYEKEIKKVAELCEATRLGEEELWALLLYLCNPKNDEKFLRAWKMPVKKIREIRDIKAAVLRREKEDWSEEMLYRTGLKIAIQAEKVYRTLKRIPFSGFPQKLEALYESLAIHNRKELAITGYDLMQWYNKKSGPWIKEMLENIERAVLNREVENDKARIKEWLQP